MKWKLLQVFLPCIVLEFHTISILMHNSLPHQMGWRHTTQHNTIQYKYTVKIELLYHDNIFDILLKLFKCFSSEQVWWYWIGWGEIFTL